MNRVLLVVQLAAPPAGSGLETPAAIAAEASEPTKEQLLQAAVQLSEQYDRTGDPAYKFGQGVALARAGDCERATAAFDEFRGTAPPPSDELAASEELAACHRMRSAATVESSPTRDEERALAQQDAAESPAREDPETPPKPRNFDRAALAMLGTGGGLALVGAGLYGASFAVAGAGGASETQTNYLQRERRTRGLVLAGAVVGTAALGLLVAGIARWATLDRRRRRLSIAHHGWVIRF